MIDQIMQASAPPITNLCNLSVLPLTESSSFLILQIGEVVRKEKNLTNDQFTQNYLPFN